MKDWIIFIIKKIGRYKRCWLKLKNNKIYINNNMINNWWKIKSLELKWMITEIKI